MSSTDEGIPMRRELNLTRRCALAAAATLLLAGCAPGTPVGSTPSGSQAAGSASSTPASVSGAWETRLDAGAPFMNIEGEEGSANPGDCWTQHEDGSVQVQVVGSSIPEPAVESVEFADGVLTLTMAQPEEGTPTTMDFVLHQFVLTTDDAPEVTGVVLVRGDERTELPAGGLAEPEDAAA